MSASDFTFAGTECQKTVLYKGEEIGTVRRASPNYAWHVAHNGNKSSFMQLSEAATMLATWVGALGATGKVPDIFPVETWILRVAQITLICSPEPGATPIVTARVYCNSHKTTGSSAASKPHSIERRRPPAWRAPMKR